MRTQIEDDCKWEGSRRDKKATREQWEAVKIVKLKINESKSRANRKWHEIRKENVMDGDRKKVDEKGKEVELMKNRWTTLRQMRVTSEAVTYKGHIDCESHCYGLTWAQLRYFYCRVGRKNSKNVLSSWHWICFFTHSPCGEFQENILRSVHVWKQLYRKNIPSHTYCQKLLNVQMYEAE